MSSKTIQLSESVIKRELAGNLTELNDARHPLRLRINKARNAGSWYLVTYQDGKKTWKKIANWPLVSVKAVTNELPTLLLKRKQKIAVTVSDFDTCLGVFNWFKNRALQDRTLSVVRKSDIKCHIDKHLIPLLGDYSLPELSKAEIDEAFIWPQQSRYRLSTLKSRFALLKRIFSQAEKLEMIKVDPFAGLKFSDFIDKAIKPKDSKLRAMDLPYLLADLDKAEMMSRFMVLLMLGFGLRIGETRQLKTRYFDVKGQQLIIPSEITKTNKELRLPLSHFFINEFNTYLKWQIKQLGYKGAYLFPKLGLRDCLDAREASKLIRNLSKSEWSAHDLRKLARSSWMDLGIDYMTSEMLLNHALSKLDETYIYTHAWNQKIDAINVWHNHLQAVKSELIKETDGRFSCIPPIAESQIYQGVR